MYYNITIFVISTGCIINAMDLKNLPNTIVLLKVDQFEGFSNRSNIDELVINSTSGCNCNNYKLNNNSAFSHSYYFLIYITNTLYIYSYLSTKFGIFPNKFKGHV